MKHLGGLNFSKKNCRFGGEGGGLGGWEVGGGGCILHFSYYSSREERRERKTEIRRKEERPAGVSGMDTRIGSVRFKDEDD